MKKYLPQFSNEYSSLFDVQVLRVIWLGHGAVRWFDYEPSKVARGAVYTRFLAAILFRKAAAALIG